MKNLIMIGGLGALALFAFGSKGARAAPSSTAPPIGPGATVETLANPLAGSGIPTLKRTSWHVAASEGQQPGTFALVQNPADQNDWVYSFKSDAGGFGVIAYSQTPKGGLLAQAAAAGY